MSTTQKQSVVNSIKSILGSSFDPNQPARDQLTPDQLKQVKEEVLNGIKAGEIDFKKDLPDDKELSRYVSGMVSNHLRKAKELNGGETYVPQSTGRGSRDPQISELNKLASTYTEGSEEYNQIISAIESRKVELTAERELAAKSRKKAKELNSINMDELPEELKSLANSLVNNS